ncbi:hypothetical protein FOZ60_014570 [Perkinsus olseni]|uniref:Uncharacterized protein n=1 Tax=Perkinsus olseni TaxID=32597 RepID=A0A7J6N8A5_PEROL|nr:hypothetical protein FOZ60_014570 [Perkinsus olseni]
MVNVPQSLGGGPVKLFVRGLSKSLTSDDVLRIFQEYGGIEEVFIMKDRETHESRGLAFVRFRDLAEGQSAIAALNGKILPESAKPLTVIYAQGEAERLGLPKESPGIRGQDTKLYVSGLGPSTEAAELRNIFEPFGRVTEVHVPGPHALWEASRTPTVIRRGNTIRYAFVRYADEKDAMRAISSLPPVSSYGSPATNGYDHNPNQGQPRFVNGMSQGYGQSGHGKEASVPLNPAVNDTTAGSQQPPASRTIGAWTEYFAMDGTPYYHNSQSNTVQWELPMEFKNPTAAHTAPQAKGPSGANVFVFSVPDAWTETDLRQNFGQFGRIISAKVVVDKQTGISRGYGFISYDNCESAARAVQTMDGYMAPTGKRIKVQIKKGEGNNDACPKHATVAAAAAAPY